MTHLRKYLHVFFAVVLVSSVLVPSAAASAPPVPSEFGAMAYSYTGLLSAMPRYYVEECDQRAAARTVKGWLFDQGYHAECQEFSFTFPARLMREILESKSPAQVYRAQNVVAFKPAHGADRDNPVPLVIIGAHYDCVPDGQGADDNASGVGALLEVTARLAEQDLPYDLAIVSFGAEEAGLEGSFEFVRKMKARDLKRTIVMINFDSLIAGDFRYIHAGSNGKTWARDEMETIIESLGLGIVEQPGLNPAYPAGFTPNWFSDYTAFNMQDIPIVAFESTNWTVGDLDGYQQCADEPTEFWHTDLDVLETIESYHSGRPLAHLRAYTTLVYTFLAGLEP